MKEKFKNYIFENYLNEKDLILSRKMVSNILEWIWCNSMDKEDSVNALSLMLDGIGISKEEIEKFIDWN